MVTHKQTTGGTFSLPKEVQALCKNVRLRTLDVAEYRVGDRVERQWPGGGLYWATPVTVLDRYGRQYSGDVVKLNE